MTIDEKNPSYQVKLNKSRIQRESKREKERGIFIE